MFVVLIGLSNIDDNLIPLLILWLVNQIYVTVKAGRFNRKFIESPSDYKNLTSVGALPWNISQRVHIREVWLFVGWIVKTLKRCRDYIVNVFHSDWIVSSYHHTILFFWRYKKRKLASDVQLFPFFLNLDREIWCFVIQSEIRSHKLSAIPLVI